MYACENAENHGWSLTISKGKEIFLFLVSVVEKCVEHVMRYHNR